jgi:protein TonB
MSYLDHTNRRHPTTIAAVAALHIGIGYVIVSGLAYQVTTWSDPPIEASILTDPPPPPPHDTPPPRAERQAQPTRLEPIVRSASQEIVETIDVRPIDLPPRTVVEEPALRDPPPPVLPKLGRLAEPGTGRAGWVTPDDYPPQTLREGVTGTVGISVAIGIDGRVTACEVTRSSGNAQLDDATCRLYARRARFRPALDNEGKAVATRFSDRIRWQLPD